jgi:hypothetical protein
MFGNILPLTTVGAAQVLPTTTVGNNDLVIIQDTATSTSQAELINQLQNHITENQQILIITDDQGQDQCKQIERLTYIAVRYIVARHVHVDLSVCVDVIIDKDQDISALLQDGKRQDCLSLSISSKMMK